MGRLRLAGDPQIMFSVEGKILVAAPQLLDPNFYHTVVFMIRHDEEGAYGLVLNRPTNQSVAHVMEMLLEIPCERSGAIMHGGPVEGPVVLLHNSPNQQDIRCGAGLYLASCQDRVGELIQCSETKLLVFDGYSGWGPGQLDEELKRGGWLVANAEPEEVFGDVDTIWDKAIKRIGRDILKCHIREAQIPLDPSTN